ncbi:MAG: AAA family ATPase [Campylobacterota bacterium]|nr:AAA family ATPase [Campylobacterota bacterium]
MKILSLKALNINSLKGKTEINFAELTKENALFAITGPTGSGKSTLLDIISCALYGRTARLKNPNNLMSRHSGEAFCEVEFEIKGEVYRSSWSQKRARKKHDGKFQTAIMELCNATSGDILEKGLREVPKRIEALCGLDFGRFTQSMMLAQGGFDAFLKADEKERSALLEKITGTQIYAEISKAVHAKHGEHQKEIELQSASLESITLLDSNLVKEKKALLVSNRSKKLHLDKEIKTVSDTLHWVQTLMKLSDENQKYTEEFSAISKEKEEKKEDFLRLDLANRALHVRALYDKKKYVEKALHINNSNSELLSSETITFKESISKNTQSYNDIFKAMKEAEKTFDTENEKLKNARHIQTQEKEIEKNSLLLQARLQEKEAQQKKLDLHVSTIKSSFTQLEDELTCKKTYLEDNTDDAKLLANMSAIQQTLKQYDNEVLSLEKVQKNTLNIEKKLIKKQDDLKNINSKIEILILTYKSKEQEFLLQKYEEDRAKLKENEACFLCGSIEHPYVDNTPAISSNEMQEVLKQELIELQDEIVMHQEKANIFHLDIVSLQAKQEQSELTLQTSKSALGSYISTLQSYSNDFTQENLQTHYKALQERKKVYIQTQKSLEIIEKKILTCKLEITENRTKSTALQTEITQDKQRLIEIQTRFENLQKERISVLNVANLQEYEKEISLTCKTKQKIEQEAKSKLETLHVQLSQNEKQEKALKQKIIDDEISLKELSQKLKLQLKEKNFENEKMLEDAILSDENYNTLMLTCKHIQEKYSQLQTLTIETEKRLQKHQEEPKSDKNKADLEESLISLQNDADALQLRIGQDEKELELNHKNETLHKEKIATLEKQKEAFKIWVKLHELIGSADGAKFKKFAQGITLEQLIRLANQHLQLLTSRYTLLRSHEEKQILELEVMDAYQGNVCRCVSTLSGGESFIVSLALALGLSSLASQKIAIDSLFLDEGFGTLDEESLETALNALNLLQDSGKMVGIISHIEALKERIPLQIKVISNGDGTSYIEL